MSLIVHHAILITGSGQRVAELHKLASAWQMNPSAVVWHHCNGEASLLIPPDGGNDGGEISKVGDDSRGKLKTFLRSLDSEVCWMELRYGPDSVSSLGLGHPCIQNHDRMPF